MIGELIFNAALLIFMIYCFIIIGQVPPASATDTLNAALYSRIIIGMLIIFLAINIVKILKNKKEGEDFKIDFDIKKLVKNKFFIGSVLLILYKFALDYIGFVVGSFILFILYSYLLGERRVKILITSSLISVVVLFVLFGGILDIILPRGVGVFRNFALFLESLM